MSKSNEAIAKQFERLNNIRGNHTSLRLTTPLDIPLLEMGGKFRDDFLKAVKNKDIKAVKENLSIYKLVDLNVNTNKVDLKSFKRIHYDVFTYAASLGFQDMVELFLTEGVDINGQNAGGDTALIETTKTGNINLTLFLLSKGADPNIHNDLGCMALEYAARYGFTEIVQCLIAKKACVNTQNRQGTSPLMWATEGGKLKIIKALLKAGAIITLEDKQHLLAPLTALMKDNFEALQLFLEYGFDINTPNSEGVTLLMNAAVNNNLKGFNFLIKAGANCQDMNLIPKLVHDSLNECLKYLLSEHKLKANTLCDDLGNTLLNCVALFGNTEILKILLDQMNGKKEELEHCNSKGATALMLAAKGGHLDCVELLLRAGANVNAKTDMGDTTLMAAVEEGHMAIFQRLMSFHKKEGKIDLESMDKNNPPYNPLILAVMKGRKQCVELLLANGADPHVLFGGDTLLMVAARKGHTEILGILLEYLKESVDHANKSGITALMHAAHGHGECVRILLANGANPNLVNKRGLSALMYASHGYRECVQILLAQSAETNISNDQGFSALSIAAYKNQPEILKILIDAKPDINAKDNDGTTALSFATYKGSGACVRLLVANGAKDTRNKNEQDALSIALLCRYHSIIEMLLTKTRVDEIISNHLEPELYHFAQDARSVQILEKAGIKGNPLNCQLQVALRLMGHFSKESIEEYIGVVNLGQPIQAGEENEYLNFDEEFLKCPLFVLSNYSEREVRFYILKCKLYQDFKELHKKSDAFVTELDKNAKDFKFSLEGDLCIHLERDGKPYVLTLTQQGIKRILTKQKLTSLRSLLWEFSEEAEELKAEEEIKRLKDTVYSKLMRFSNQIDHDSNLMMTLTEVIRKNELEKNIKKTSISQLLEISKNHRIKMQGIWDKIRKKMMDMGDKKEISAFNETIETIILSYQAEVREPLSKIQQDIETFLEKSKGRNKTHNSKNRKEKQKPTLAADIRKDEIGNMVPKNLIFSQMKEKPRKVENSTDVQELERQRKRLQDEVTKITPKKTPAELSVNQKKSLQSAQKRFVNSANEGGSDALTSVISLNSSDSVVSSSHFNTNLEQDLDLRRYMRVPKLTLASVTQLYPHLKAKEGRAILKNTGATLIGNCTGALSLIEGNAALGALAQTLETRKGLKEEWPSHVRDVIFHFEEAIKEATQKNHPEEALIHIIRSISQNLDKISEAELVKRKGKLPLGEIDFQNFLKTLTAKFPEIPGFSKPRADQFIRQSEEELTQIKTFLLAKGLCSFQDQKWMDKVMMATGFVIARIGTHLQDILNAPTESADQKSGLEKKITKEREACPQYKRYKKWLSLARQYRHNEPIWKQGVQTIINQWFSSHCVLQQSVPEIHSFNLEEIMFQPLTFTLALETSLDWLGGCSDKPGNLMFSKEIRPKPFSCHSQSNQVRLVKLLNN